MKIKHINDQKIVWVYLNISDSLVAWEIYRGVLISPDCYLVEDNPSISFRQLSYLKNIKSISSANELKLELVRQKFYPDKISRFRGFYCFDDKETALNAAKLWGSNNHYNVFCLSEVGVPFDSIYSKMDSNWITKYAGKRSNDDSWMHYYWKGEVCPDFSEPIWELLIVARGFVYNNELRERSYEKIKRENKPSVLPLLEISRLAALLGFDLGHICPYVIKKSNQKYEVIDIIDMRDAENSYFLQKLNNYINNIDNREYVNFSDLKLFGIYNGFSVPDTRIRSFEFELPSDIADDFDIQKMPHIWL